ncbi:hypothetical protein TNCV_4694161 [Trichonephila clavipes]|uniref:Uncharacterized protein n=1 Tax=Trichonephila clavipes TaxID=2585209 RepID=A0A8X6WBK5_TRICX|nr:hypothetical protein TNCV_4694161 [Trichonephila clavipes]
MRDLNAKSFDLIPAISRKIKGVSEIRNQILVSYPDTHLMSTFGASDPASSVPERGITVVRHYPKKLRLFSPYVREHELDAEHIFE